MQTILFRRLPLQRLFHAATALAGAGALGLSLALAPGAGAQQLPKAHSLAVTASDLGPGWTQRDQTSPSIEGVDTYGVGFSKDGRVAAFIVAVAPYEDAAEFAIKSFRASFDRSGVPVSSVQDRGFGDGSAFKVVLVGGSKVLVAFMYRVHNAAVLVMYTGTSTSEAEALKEAETFARLQESKLWAALAPPTPAPAPSPMPTPPPAIPAPIPTPIPTPAVVAQPVVPPAPMVVADPYCLPGQKPAFAFGFAALKERLGPIMGDPTSCEYGDPKGSGDTLQNTSAGLSFYRKSTNTPTFTTGYEHWAQTDGGLVYWTGDSIDPTSDAQVVESPA